MDNRIVYISFFTKNTAYELVMNKFLRPSLDRFNLKYDIHEIQHLGNWFENTRFKPLFIREKLEKYDTVVWLDADAVIFKEPTLFDLIPPNYPIALHKLDWNKQYGYGDTKEVLSGTLMVRRSAIPIVNEWIAKSKDYNWEQKALEKVLEGKEYLYYELPVEYCTVITKDNKIPTYVKDPIIVHYQVSRKLKKEMSYIHHDINIVKNEENKQ